MRRSWQAISLRLVAVQVEMGVAMEMSKERLAGAIKVGFAQGRVPEPVLVDVIEHKFDQPRDAESDLRRRGRRGEVSGATGGTPIAPERVSWRLRERLEMCYTYDCKKSCRSRGICSGQDGDNRTS